MNIAENMPVESQRTISGDEYHDLTGSQKQLLNLQNGKIMIK